MFRLVEAGKVPFVPSNEASCCGMHLFKLEAVCPFMKLLHNSGRVHVNNTSCPVAHVDSQYECTQSIRALRSRRRREAVRDTGFCHCYNANYALGLLRVEVTEDTKIPNAATIKIVKQDHTLGNMLRA